MRWSSMLGVWQGALGVVMVALLVVASANDYDDDAMIENLYKRISEMEDYYNENEAYGGQSDLARDDIGLEARDSQQAELRDHEYLQQAGSNDGFQYISGGAGEGSQHLTPEGTQNNTQEVKSDESLPFYCHPPNPCPKGFTESDGCQSNIADTAEAQKAWIQNLMISGKCSCDEEHMFNCPKNLDIMNTAKGHAERDNLDKVLDNLLSGKNNFVNPFGGEKRDSVVAKKSPGMWHDAQEEPVMNPFLEGQKLASVAKKGMMMK